MRKPRFRDSSAGLVIALAVIGAVALPEPTQAQFGGLAGMHIGVFRGGKFSSRHSRHRRGTKPDEASREATDASKAPGDDASRKAEASKPPVSDASPKAGDSSEAGNAAPSKARRSRRR